MITSNRRIFLAIFLSFFIFFGIKYLYANPQVLSPDSIYAGITQKTNQLVTKISSMRLPNLANLFTLNFNFSRDEPINGQTDQSASINFGQAPTGIGQPTPTNFIPTPTLYLSPTQQPFKPSPTLIKNPTPTKYIKPTKTPTAVPFKLTNPRPGKNFREVAEIVGRLICIPPAMILATLENEYGAWIPQVEATWIVRNTYNGFDPHDKPGSSTVPFVAVMQMMEDTWYKIKPVLTSQYLNSNELSLEVTFDSMVAGAYHLRNISLAMQDKISCDDWPVKYILYGACRYNGACAAGSHTYNNYTYGVCNAYNRYTTGPKKICK